MPSAAVVEIMDATVTLLNGHTFSQGFTAVRAYDLTYDIKAGDMDTLKVTVMPGARANGPDTRGSDQNLHQLNIAVEQRVVGEDLALLNAAVDPLVYLVEEIALFVSGKVLTVGPSRYTLLATVQIDPVCDREMLHSDRVFASAVTVTARERRTVR